MQINTILKIYSPSTLKYVENTEFIINLPFFFCLTKENMNQENKMSSDLSMCTIVHMQNKYNKV